MHQRREAAWPSGYTIRFEICRPRVQIPFWPLAYAVHGSPEFNFSATLVNNELVCLPSVGIHNLVVFIEYLSVVVCLYWSWKAPMGSGQTFIHLQKSYRVLTELRNKLSCSATEAKRMTTGTQNWVPIRNLPFQSCRSWQITRWE